MNHASIPYLEILSFSWLLSAPSRCTLIVTNEGARLRHVSSTQLLVPPANIYRQAVWILSCNWDALGAKWGSDSWDGGRGRGVVMVMRWLPRKYRKETICGSKALQQRNNKEVGGWEHQRQGMRHQSFELGAVTTIVTDGASHWIIRAAEMGLYRGWEQRRWAKKNTEEKIRFRHR